MYWGQMTRSDAAAVSPRRTSALSLLRAACGSIIDVALAAAVSLVIVVLAGRAAAPLAFTLGVAALVAAGWGLLSRGRSLGWGLAGVRLIAAESGSAPGMSGVGNWAVADVRVDGDPIAPYAAIPDLAPLAPQTFRVPAALLASPPPVDSAVPAGDMADASKLEAAEPVRAPAPARTFVSAVEPAGDSGAQGETMIYRAKLRQGTSVMVIDGERSVVVTARMVVGRNPTVEAGEVAVAIPDMSRDLSKNHLRVDQDAYGQLVVTDLGSTNGTRLRSIEGARAKLKPHVSTPVRWGETLELGTQHVVQFESRVRGDEAEQQGE